MKPRNWWNIETSKDDEKEKATTLFLKDVYNILNKGATLNDNIKGTLVSIEFTASNTNTVIRHGLDYVPSNYLICGTDSAIHVYDGSIEADKVFFYLRASAIGSARVFIF